jgi:hypothetical protein
MAMKTQDEVYAGFEKQGYKRGRRAGEITEIHLRSLLEDERKKTMLLQAALSGILTMRELYQPCCLDNDRWCITHKQTYPCRVGVARGVLNKSSLSDNEWPDCRRCQDKGWTVVTMKTEPCSDCKQAPESGGGE